MDRFNEVFEDDTSNVKKIPKGRYKEYGKIPIIDQGRDFIAGYTDEEYEKKTRKERIIFGDHTRIIKYVNFESYIGADGVKVLKLKKDNINYKYMYYYLKNIYIPNTGYNRHYKWLKETKFEIPTEIEQIEIVRRLDKVQEIIDIRKIQIEELDKLIKSQFVEMFENEKYPKKSLIDVCEELFAGGDVNKEHKSKERTDKYKYPIYTNGEKLDGLYGYTDIVRVNKEAVTISGRGTIGFSCIRKEPFYPAVRLIVAVPNKDIIDTIFLRQFIENKNYGGQGASIPQLTVPMIKNELIPIPPIEVQKQFADIVKQIDKQKFEIQKSLEETQKLQESLMNKYFG